MSTSYSFEYPRPFSVPVAVLEYPDISAETATQRKAQSISEDEARRGRTDGSHPEAEIVARIERERADAARETEQRLRKEYEQKLIAARAPIAAAVAAFELQRKDYFARVESEVVQLALAIAAKILHREAAVDPMLVAALVRIAIEKMREGSSVTVRVKPGLVESWRRYLLENQTTAHVVVTEDAQLGDQDCVVETELGSANFGLEAQLKEVEQGFFDLLALRPAS